MIETLVVAGDPFRVAAWVVGADALIGCDASARKRERHAKEIFSFDREDVTRAHPGGGR